MLETEASNTPGETNCYKNEKFNYNELLSKILPAAW